MTTAPNLEPHCGSWIIADNDVAVIETWSRSYADRIASRETPGVIVYTAQQWLARINAKLQAEGAA